jgi:hypothetical protein
MSSHHATTEFGSLNRVTEYLIFDEVRVTTKTRQWSVSSKSSGAVLGWIKWYGPWRQFVFVPYDAVFNAGCLNDVQDFLKSALANWRESKKERV